LDSTCSLIEQSFPEVKLLRNEKNKGFGNACNQGINAANTAYAFVMNPDTVLREDTLERLFEKAEVYPNAAILAPQLYNEDQSLQLNYNSSLFERDSYKGKVQAAEGDSCFGFILGAAMFIRKAAFKGGNYFDPSIFLFYEDDEICLQARALGKELIIVPEAQMTHLYGRSSGFSWRVLWLKNYHIAWSKHYIEHKYKRSSNIVQDVLLYACKGVAYSLILQSKKAVKSFARCAGAFSFMRFGK
jgi:GT2 family glycosyltransferase